VHVLIQTQSVFTPLVGFKGINLVQFGTVLTSIIQVVHTYLVDLSEAAFFQFVHAWQGYDLM
jgi:hypothetical protein